MENPVKKVTGVFKPVQQFREDQIAKFQGMLEDVSKNMEFLTDEEATVLNIELLRRNPRVNRVLRVVNRIFWGSLVASWVFNAGLFYLGDHPVSSKEGNLILGALLTLGTVGSLVTEIGAVILNNDFNRVLRHFAFERTIEAVAGEGRGSEQVLEYDNFMARE